MGFIIIILLVMSSLFLSYQSMSVLGFMDSFIKVTIPKLNSNNILFILGLEISKWGIVLGVLGLIFATLNLISWKNNIKPDGKMDRFTIGLTFLLIIFVFASLC